MFKSMFTLTLTLALTALPQSHALAWELHTLPTASTQSSTAHYGGNKAPLILSGSHIKTAAANASGMHIWDSQNDGISWTSTLLTNTTAITQVYLASDTLALGWSFETAPTMFHYAASSDSWSAASHVWPLASWKIIHVSTSTSGDIIVLATTPAAGKLVEGELFILYGNSNGWRAPVLLSQTQALVADATLVNHSSGLQSVVWSQRSGHAWDVLASNSNDGLTWSSTLTIVQNIAAPFFQEAAVQIAADALNNDEIALAFTGWSLQAHSQVWSKAFDAVSGVTTQAMTLLPDAGDMVVQPSLVTLTSNTWAVAWQQKIGLDTEIYVAQHQADGTWTDAVNVSADSMHMDRDPHIALGASHTLNVAFTRRIQADTQEVYTFAEGDIHDNPLDSDGDGIADSQERGFDLNNDGIDDAQSARVATWANADGRYALEVTGNGELFRVQAPTFSETGIEAPASYTVEGSLFAFQIRNLSPGESTQVHLITPHSLDDDVTWLKLNSGAQWANSESDNVSFDATQTGLYINLTDGGAGDEDGVSNGVIVDPAVLATPRALAQVTATDSTASPTAEGGCLTPSHTTPWSFVVLMMMAAGTLASRKTLKA